MADDIADEGDFTVEQRLRQLDDWEQRLVSAYAGEADDPLFAALAETVRTCNIPITPLRDLLRAFRFDADNPGYETMDDLLTYCRYSANPVGRIVLRLFDLDSDERLAYSDEICTGLQLANFWQDISVDVPRGRINIPRETLRRFGYDEEQLHHRIFNTNFRRMLIYLVERTEGHFRRGRALLTTIPQRRLRMELAATVGGGERVLEKIRGLDYEVLSQRPGMKVVDVVRVVMGMAGRRIG